MTTQALVLRTAGTNCDMETVHALETSGAKADLLHLSEVILAPKKIHGYSILVVPGGFSYGDDIAAGKILANEIRFKIADEIRGYVAAGKIVIGICNGFQVLAKAGLLPGNEAVDLVQTATLAHNDSGRFQCEWVGMKKEKSKAAWLSEMPDTFELPMAHGEGKFVPKDLKVLESIEKNGQVVFRYHPRNPNGSTHAIAGICNPRGNVVGLMPHPERFLEKENHPAWTRNGLKGETPGRIFWKCAVKHAKEI